MSIDFSVGTLIYLTTFLGRFLSVVRMVIYKNNDKPQATYQNMLNIITLVKLVYDNFLYDKI